MKNIKFISLFNLFKDGVKQEAMVSLCNFIELPVLVKKIGWRIVASIFTLQGKVSFRLRQMHNFYNYVLILRKRHGDKFCVAYLKASQLAIQKAIAKDKISSLREIDSSYSFPRLSSCGLPRYIPLSDRRAIMNRSSTVIRWWLTLYSLYRIVDIPGKFKLETITDPFSGNLLYLERVSLDLKILVLRYKKNFPLHLVRQDKGLQFFESASPSSSVSWFGIFTDPMKLASVGLGQDFLDIMQMMGYSKLLDYWVKIFRYSKSIEKLINLEYFKSNSCPGVGKLSIKKEAAGKIRVFAMVDIWTQSLLYPLHNMLFSFLKSIPNDGTFNQSEATLRAAKKSIKYQCSFGYDLSAATDRLPLSLQIAIISSLIGEKYANLWGKILVGRDYYLNDRDLNSDGSRSRWHSYRYSVGQPMGALSSWAMLAVTHHFLVQLAYQRAYSKNTHLLNSAWFEGYELLGDDIVIFDALVASEYLLIMEGIGVPINVSKSVVAKNSTVEFAKVTTHYGVNVSALSWKMFISQNNLMGRVNILYSLINKGYSPKSFLSWADGIVRSQMKKRSNYMLFLLPLLTMFSQSGKITLDSVLSAIDGDGNVTSSKLIKGANEAYFINLIVHLSRGYPLRLKKSNWSPRWYLEWLRRTTKKVVDPYNHSKDLALKVVDSLFNFGRREMTCDFAMLIGPVIYVPGTSSVQLHDFYEDMKRNAPVKLPDTYSIIWDTQVTDPSHILTENLAIRTSLYNILRDELFSKMDIVENSPLFFETIEEGINYANDYDRYLEILSIFDRGSQKIFEKRQPVELPKYSLKLLKVLLSTKKFKDKWSKK